MKDRFSSQSHPYSVFRPLYPQQLYDFLFSNVSEFEAAWDAGTGNGQAARELAKRFSKVYATDISAKQLESAHKASNIFYSQAGEIIQLPDQSVDLVTVAQAVHWFDREKFYKEVKRVVRPGGVLAVWGYSLLSIDDRIDPLIKDFYVNVVGPYWDPERKLVDERLKTIAFPFVEIDAPSFNFSFDWTIEELKGYLSTWSSVQKYIAARHVDPVLPLLDDIRSLWSHEKLRITFPLFIRMGKI